MDIKRIWAVAVKETSEIARDKLFAALAFGLPTFLMLLLGFSLSTDVEHVPIAIVDNDNTFASRRFRQPIRQLALLPPRCYRL